MKLNKTFGRIATTLVATAMLASMAVVPASANSAVGTPQTELNTITITKRLEMPSGVTTPVGKEFKFNIEEATVTGTQSITSANTTFDVNSAPTGSGVDNAGSAIITDSTRNVITDTDNVYVTATATLRLPDDTNFNDPGVYKYTIDEQDVGTNYVDHSTALDLYLFVERNDTDTKAEKPYIITGAVVYPTGSDANGEGKDDVYTNYYMLDESGESTVGTITIGKEIEGTMASPNDEFTFKIEGLDLTKSYSTSNPRITLGKIDENTTVDTFTLCAGEELTINGVKVSEDFAYTITEQANNKGYSLTNIEADENDGDVVQVNKEAETFVSADVKVEKNEDSGVTFTNTRNAVSPTGLVMDIAPYVLLVAVAAAGCFVFLRKRRED